jgi:hypothetical protein
MSDVPSNVPLDISLGTPPIVTTADIDNQPVSNAEMSTEDSSATDFSVVELSVHAFPIIQPDSNVDILDASDTSEISEISEISDEESADWNNLKREIERTSPIRRDGFMSF